MSEAQLNIETTKDGSFTLYNAQLDATYHSRFGAMQESRHVFIQNGLDFLFHQTNESIRILEVGFGTGLNALLTALACEEIGREVLYQSIERFPLSSSIVVELAQHASLKPYSHLFNRLHSSEWEKIAEIKPGFQLLKNAIDFIHFIPTYSYHLIYFDAFAPEKVPAMWSEERLRQLYKAMEDNGVLVTYCAKGSFKRLLKHIGFKVETLKGPFGKREMTRAVKV